MQKLNRRATLKALTLSGAGICAAPALCFGQGDEQRSLRAILPAYLKAHRRPDGGYSWANSQRSHLTPTYAVIGAYKCLGLTPPDFEQVATFVRANHPSVLKKLEQEHREFELQQIQSLLWLGQDVSSFRSQVEKWRTPTTYLKQYEQHGYPILRHEVAAFVCRGLLGMSLEDLSPDYISYLHGRRRANGSFNNTPASDGADGHVINTWWGLQALRSLGKAQELKEQAVMWLRGCQLPNGGFTWQPKPEFAANDDVAYAWAALQSLRLLGAKPADPARCTEYILSLLSSEGGFAPRPGWQPNPLATFYALQSLEILGALDAPETALARTPRPRSKLGSMSDLRVFSIQLEAHGKGSPSEAVDLADALRIQLWGAKNATPKWLSRAQQIAAERKAEVTFFAANEEYGTWVNTRGLGTYSHTSDVIAPAGCDFGASMANAGVVSWPEFRTRRLGPLLDAGGRLIWQFGENEELVRLFLDDSLDRGGYAAISTFHFGNPDFTNTEPFLENYKGQLPFVALQDAHGDEPWWFADMTTGFRTVFLAKEPTWSGWLKALEMNWVAAVRHDATSGDKTWMHYSSDEVLEIVKKQEAAWRWWDNAAIQRPLVSLVALKAEDEFETARPTNGVTLRVRCAWQNTAQGRPKTPLAELVELLLDGKRVDPQLAAPRAARGAGYLDHYHHLHLPKLDGKKHVAEVVVRELSSNTLLRRRIEFQA